jgi:hypothetical protein
VLIDCDTCTVRGHGCADCVVTVLLGAPPGWRGSDPTVVPLTRRPAAEGREPQRRAAGGAGGPQAAAGHPPATAGDAPDHAADRCDLSRVDTGPADGRPVVELDEVERRAVRALADFGLVPPLRHQDASASEDRHVS